MYKLSNLAVEDFTAIYEYTLLNFGVMQADKYTEHLESTFNLLATSPLRTYPEYFLCKSSLKKAKLMN